MIENSTELLFYNETSVVNFLTEIITEQISVQYNKNDINVDNITDLFGPKRDPYYIVIPITIIYMIIFITGIIGNISTCIVIYKNKSMHTATNYYLFSLAISDFFLLVSGVPQEIYFIWSKYPYVFGELFCILRGLIAETSANATVLCIVAFTIERYVAICHPFLSHTMSKLSRAVKLIIGVWIISIFLAIPQALQFGIVQNHGMDQCVVKQIIVQHSFELSTFLFFFTPMTLITVLYVLIGIKLRSSSLMKRENGGTLHRRCYVNSCRQQNNQGTKRVLKMLVAVVVAFFICWAPFHAQRLVAIYGTIDHQPSHETMLQIYVIMTYVSGILYYLSTCINPLLYNIMSNKFREAFKATLAKCCQISKGRNDQKRTYRVLSRSQRRSNGKQESTSGNSIRDDSLCSSSTQKQSIADSSTLIRKQSTIRYTSKYENIEIIPYTRDEGCKSCELVQNDEHSTTSQIKVYYSKKNGLQITETDNKSTKKAFKTKIWKWFHSDFNKSKFSSSNKINFEINIDINDHPDTSVIGPIRNYSLKDVDNQANLKDELSVYMEELKMREKG